MEGREAGMNAGGGDNHNNSNGSGLTIQTVLSFLHSDWARMERERAEWKIQKADLEAKCARLAGERTAQQGLLGDLLRRVKMLEHALVTERAKSAQAASPSTSSAAAEATSTKPEADASLVDPTPTCKRRLASVEDGRKVLRTYLHELGVTDSLISAQAAQLRSAFAGSRPDFPSPALLQAMAAQQVSNLRTSHLPASDLPPPPPHPAAVAALDARKSAAAAVAAVTSDSSKDLDAADVLANFDFLDDSPDAKALVIEDDSDEGREEAVAEMDSDVAQRALAAAASKSSAHDDLSFLDDMLGSQPSAAGDDGSEEREEQLEEFAGNVKSSQLAKVMRMGNKRGRKSSKKDGDDIDGQREIDLLGELATLTMGPNDDDVLEGSGTGFERDVKRWRNKTDLNSHLDGVRDIAFHNDSPLLISGSEDHTVKLWSLKGPAFDGKKHKVIPEVEPIHTYRGHTDAVMSVAVDEVSDFAFSGSADTTIRVWKLFDADHAPYDHYQPSEAVNTLIGHTDIVWSVVKLLSKQRLFSVSADGTCRVWDYRAKSPLLHTYTSASRPTCASVVHSDFNKVAVSYVNAKTAILDIETGKTVVEFDSASTSDGSSKTQINCVTTHPVMNVLVTAHEDQYLRTYDLNSGKIINSILGHQSAVTSLSYEHTGLRLVSAGHDSSVRFWNVESMSCEQELTVHRPKFDEAIHRVIFHPSKPLVASGGADGSVKLYVQ